MPRAFGRLNTVRKHVTPGQLNKAIADVVNAYLRLDLLSYAEP
ncbi:hypothetical protein AB0M44_35910 [Streptosporangium subroseum]